MDYYLAICSCHSGFSSVYRTIFLAGDALLDQLTYISAINDGMWIKDNFTHLLPPEQGESISKSNVALSHPIYNKNPFRSFAIFNKYLHFYQESHISTNKKIVPKNKKSSVSFQLKDILERNFHHCFFFKNIPEISPFFIDIFVWNIQNIFKHVLLKNSVVYNLT